MNKLFVYGTLRKSRIQSVIPEVAPFVKNKGNGFIRATLFDLGDYPGAVDLGLTTRVHGDILEISPDKLDFVLTALDKYEEINTDPEKSLFKRAKALVNTKDGKKLFAWVYWYNKDINGAREIKSGIYRKRKTVIE